MKTAQDIWCRLCGQLNGKRREGIAQQRECGRADCSLLRSPRAHRRHGALIAELTRP